MGTFGLLSIPRSKKRDRRQKGEGSWRMFEGKFLIPNFEAERLDGTKERKRREMDLTSGIASLLQGFGYRLEFGIDNE